MNITDRPNTPLNHRLARNFALAIFVALPLAIATTTGIFWLHPPPDAREPLKASFEGFVGGMAFWYLILFIPTIFFGAIHQAVLGALPDDWSPRQTRLAIVTTAVAEGVLIGLFVGRGGGAEMVLILTAALLPGSIVYGLFAAPLCRAARPRGWVPE
jgi:hypothetical protein